MNLLSLTNDSWTVVAAVAAAIAALAATLQTVFVAIAVVYGLRQTSELGRQLRLSVMTSHYDYLEKVNELILDPQNDELARGIGQNRNEAFFSILMGIFESWWAVGADKKSRLVTNDEWKSCDATIRATMQYEFMYTMWLAPKRREQYPENFAKYIDELLPPSAIKLRSEMPTSQR